MQFSKDSETQQRKDANLIDNSFCDTKILYNPDFRSPVDNNKRNFSTLKNEMELKKRRLGFNLNLGTPFTGKNDA